MKKYIKKNSKGYDLNNAAFKLFDFIKEKKSYVTVLSCLVVFITTYLLILPAITLDKDEADKQGGIDIQTQQEHLEDIPVKDPDADTNAKASDSDKIVLKTEEDVESGDITYAGKGYEVSANCDRAGLPEGTELVAEEINKSNQDYGALYEDALKAVREDSKDKRCSLAFAKFYDISLLSGEETVEPDGPVDVTISFDKALKASDAKNVRIVHFAVDEKTGEVIPEVLDADAVTAEVKNNKMQEATFEATSFSVYGIVYTVDFEWEVDGKKYDCSLPGGGCAGLEELVTMLGIVGSSEEAQEFVADVEDVEFSNPDLIWVGKAEEETTVGELKEANELECQYSDELTDEQIEEIDAKTVSSGDWALISIVPFTSEESLTVTMKTGEVFTIKVTDAQYDATVIPATNLDGATGALVNLRNNNALLDVARDSSHLRATGVTVSGGSITSDDSLTKWTFTKVPGTNDQYYISSSNGYLHIGSNGGLSVSEQQQALQVQTKSDGTIRIKHPDNNNAVNNTENSTSNGYGTYSSTWDANPGEWFTVYSLSVHHVTVHYVDRNGKELTGVQYTGGNSDVVANANGTFTIPYDISGNVDLRANFNFENVVREGAAPAEYTYANTHLAGVSGESDGRALTYDGLLIDSNLKSSNGSLLISTDSGETWPDDGAHNDWHYNSDTLKRGNRNYSALVDYDLSNTMYARSFAGPNSTAPKVYSEADDKEIYVVLDPLPGENASSPSGEGGNLDADPPKLTKTMVPNNDGTYTLKLTVDAHGKNVSETNQANIIFIVDTSSSMRAVTTGSNTRITDTHDAAKAFGQELLAYNTTDHPNAVQLSMITFDGSVIDRVPWTTSSSTFTTAVDEYLRYYYLHQGTDWEDSLKRALEMVKNPPDDDPMFVVFFTDGEPSQYTNFHGAQTNPNADPTNQSNPAEQLDTNYPNFYSYFLSREGSKDEMRAIIDSGAQLYAIYAYNTTNQSYNGYNGAEDGALMLHNALKYGYNTPARESLAGKVFYEATSTTALQQAFDKIYNLITEKVGFSNVVVNDGIAEGVTSSTVLKEDEASLTYVIRDEKKQVAYQVTVAPNGVTADMTPAPETGTPIFKLRDGSVHIGEIKSIPVAKIVSDSSGNHTTTVQVPVYYYKDSNDKEYIMPISTTGENISWDLSPLGILKDGYSYEVNFVVWPNQDAYDLVADLNNGNPQGRTITENWSSSNPDVTTHEDAKHRTYKIGGIKEYPYISRYDDTGEYCAMSNTNQSVDYHKIDEKIVNGQEQTTIFNKVTDTVPPPDPMPLTDTQSRLEKLWNYERDPGIFAQYLYKTNGDSKEFKVDFDIFQGSNLTDPYTTVSLGWDPAANNGQGAYVWAPGDTMTNVTYAGHPHQIGTRWVNDFGIATGLMLTIDRMEALGLNENLYPSTVFEGVTYYILEPGHDYTIKEKGEKIGYEFDFHAPVYHPMLVNNVLKNVEIAYTYETDDHGNQVIKTATISSMSNNEVGLSGLEIQNTLRGYINLNKIVVDEDGQRVNSDNTKFEYTIRLESPTSPGPFKGTHIPWYGVNGLFYNDGSETYYQVYETQNHTWMIRNEAGREYPVTSTGFDPDDAEAQTVTYEINGQSKQITLYGNQMTATEDGTIATAELAITQNETLYIANIPEGTEYTITEKNIDEYSLIDILKEVRHGSDVEQSQHVADPSNREASGTIVTNRDNHVTYTNQIKTGELKITKTIQKNGSTDTSATGTFYYAVYDEPYDASADPAQTPVRTGSIEVTENGTNSVKEEDLKIGTYYVYELSSENGTPVTSGGIFSGGKYYAVSTTGSPAAVEEDGTANVGIVNHYETVPVEATKSWADNNPDHLTVYFKLFYKNAGGVDVTTGTPLEELPYGTTTVTWPEMPKYDENGQAYNYIVREYVLDEEHGEFTEDGHKYTEAAPNGYVNTEAGLTVTNSKLETYDPETTYSGIKLWVDTVNGSKTRPDGLNVTLMIDKEPFNNPAGDVEALDEDGHPYQMAWVTIDEDEWRYTFHHLPMFDENKQIINYYAVETPVDGYAASTTEEINTKYEYSGHTLDHTENDAYPVMNSDADLVYTAVRIQHEEHLHHIWTQRVPTDAEKSRLVELLNQDLTSRNLPADATVGNVRWVDGLPINHEFVWKAQPNGYKVSFTRFNTNTIHVKVDNHGAFSNICYGTLKYNYTAGSTNFKNELQPVSYSVEKNWANGKNPPEGSVIVVELQGTVRPNPQGETAVVDLASVGVSQKIQVTLNGGAQDGDDTTAKPWKYTWSNLPPRDKDGNEITYSVKEISYTIGGHTVNLKDFAPTEDTASTEATTILTNQIPAFSMEIIKIDAGSAATLSGAEFTIQAIQPTSSVSDPTTVGDAAPSVPQTTGQDGRVRFNDIPLGYYEVEETESPVGYIRTGDGKFYVRVDTDEVKLLKKVISDDGSLSFEEVAPGAGGRIILDNVELTKTGNTFTLTVENTSGAELPNSGGPGTTWIYLIGILLLLGCGIALVSRRRTQKN